MKVQHQLNLVLELLTMETVAFQTLLLASSI